MCLLALLHRVVEDAPLVAGANREEFYDRGGEPPRILEETCRAVAGVDPLAGGTWFGLNEHGLLVAVTNRPRSEPPRQPRSRGLLARDLLACPDAAAAADLAGRELGQNRYAGCNVLCADRQRALVLLAGDWLRVRPLPPGIHIVTNRDVNETGDRRQAYALGWLASRPYATSGDCVKVLQELCAYPGNGGPPICLHGDRAGTVSSSIVVVRPRLAECVYLHAQGPPDRTPYTDYSHLLRQLAAAQKREG